ncbi:MAG: hypothetical protein ING69_10530 [Rhodocyclaceae bacterium]|nr:hypothetical protein [Rhodocyclaceae bacterium]
MDLDHKKLLRQIVTDKIARIAAITAAVAFVVFAFVGNPAPPPDILTRPAQAALTGTWPPPRAGSQQQQQNLGTQPPISIEPTRPSIAPSAPVGNFLR